MVLSAADVVAPDAPGVVDLEEVDEEAQAFETQELVKVDRQDTVQLALVDRAGAEPAAHVGQNVVGVFQAIDHAALAEPFAKAGGIAVFRQAGRNRGLRQEAVLEFGLAVLD